MEKVILARSDIISRLDVIGRYRLVSNSFLKRLLEALDTSGDNISKFSEEMKHILSTFTDDLERVRFELARIPAVFQVVKTSRTNLYGRRIDFIGLKRGDYTFSLESKLCPDWVPNLEPLHRDPIWCLCTEEQARNLRIPAVPCWNEADSLVDWIADVANTPLTIQDEIYRYIVEHSPCRTLDILSQQFTDERYVYRCLRDLQAADKIEKVKHGYYQAI